MTENVDNYFEGGRGFCSNPFRKGYLTDEERKQPFRYFAENFIFFSKTADLSEGLEIYRNPWKAYPDLYYKTWENAFAHDLIQFGIWWSNNVHKRLNGFNGWDTVKIEVDPSIGFKLNSLTIPCK